ncbi:hypothetical protein RHSIM_Rhsim06G0102400 [Rhododendron simsii]|uniref:Uncharacterized protein n=1 Tax=Rhododendron simsii TaxID=118357 RepID=A0A834GUL1_RHOSS|nr:hypothetical protein RHSIM_Rhsim06G0102400 [Rhododendron simsii]
MDSLEIVVCLLYLRVVRVCKMVLHVQFLRWDSIGNPSTSSSRTALYYLETADGQQVIAALALCTEDTRLIYRAFNQFVEEYQDLLHLGSVVEWNYVFLLNAWLYDIVYHSFVRHSTGGVSQFWYFKSLSMPAVPEVRCSVRLLLYVWVCFHGLLNKMLNCFVLFAKFEHKLILACERKWVFHAVMFDVHGYELVFDWSRPNGRWHDLHPPLDNARTAALPSAFMAHHTVLKFLCFNVYGLDLHTEFEAQLKAVFKMLSLEQMVLRMANCTWTIQIEDWKLNVQQFNQFAAALHVQFLNHVMVTILPSIEFVVIVFDGRYDSCLSLFCSEDNEYLMFVYIMAGMLFVTALAVSMLSFLS